MTGNSAKSGLILTARDERLLHLLVDLRIADRDQIAKGCGFTSVTRVNARLLKLVQAGLLRRFFVGTRAGGMKGIYSLSARSARQFAGAGTPLQRAAESILSGDAFVSHQLAINEIHLALRFDLPAQARFTKWLRLRRPISKTHLLIPDGYCELEVRAESVPVFLEVDLGTEKLSVLDGKFGTYLALALSGEFVRVFGRNRFRVLVVTESERRLENLRVLAGKHTTKLFWFSTLEAIKRSGPFAAIWKRPEGSQCVPLI